ncbi:hypothetical protein [Noviherbaspirillum sp. UKPF54]|uniref:hypothetical protein n=1 Tax=Noviherbaspirillum sp. UKPF54 TaxID=2601898 RepID=UPI00143D2B28|nr:hypothetical protein [Noviherbaspirillum sp. UKPF54]
MTWIKDFGGAEEESMSAPHQSTGALHSVSPPPATPTMRNDSASGNWRLSTYDMKEST